MIGEQLDTTVLATLDFEVACDSAHHDKVAEFHEGPAAYLMFLPCGLSGFRCAKIIDQMRADGVASCLCTQSMHSFDEFTLFQLNTPVVSA
ncbi:hypothetical protein [Cryobacterium cryoconiti]|uniref:Uncharacterized protein n=1 Tax=Cryobacterium cryoconiti TaxID=1259239 RepID=A0A4Y8JRC9_9MICO|nr:hypothetical protein [Cryobacterium cryoconiti]TFD27478.1 hypothetical protein E3T49_13115 [Cryobacterium cryoconiti]